MKTSWLRNIAMVVMLAMSVSMQVYAQKPNPAQQVALDALYNALPDDTITLSYSNDSKTYYFLSANGTGVQGATAVEGKLALWKVQKENNYGFRLQNVGNEKWLLIEQGKGRSTVCITAQGIKTTCSMMGSKIRGQRKWTRKTPFV